MVLYGVQLPLTPRQELRVYLSIRGEDENSLVARVWMCGKKEI